MNSGFCMKCKSKQVMRDATAVSVDTKRGVKYMLRGFCVACGTVVSATIKKPE